MSKNPFYMSDLGKNNKRYYTIGEVADMFGLSKSLIRFWESEFDSFNPHKTSKGERKFTEQNIEQLKIIHSLVKERGFTLKGAKKELELRQQYHQQRLDSIDALERLRAFLVDLQSKLD